MPQTPPGSQSRTSAQLRKSNGDDFMNLKLPKEFFEHFLWIRCALRKDQNEPIAPLGQFCHAIALDKVERNVAAGKIRTGGKKNLSTAFIRGRAEALLPFHKHLVKVEPKAQRLAEGNQASRETILQFEILKASQSHMPENLNSRIGV